MLVLCSLCFVYSCECVCFYVSDLNGCVCSCFHVCVCVFLVGGPEPAVDVLGEEVGAVAAVKVAQATRCPEVRHVL